MGFCAYFQRFSLCPTNILFIVGVWILTGHNSLELSRFSGSLRASGLQEGRTIEASKISQTKTD
jgi:hypothetical protein